MAIAYKVAAVGPSGSPGYSSRRREPATNPWEPYKLKLFPKKINGHQYWPGDMVYRRYVLTPGGGYWKYGDEFDYLRWTE